MSSEVVLNSATACLSFFFDIMILKNAKKIKQTKNPQKKNPLML